MKDLTTSELFRLLTLLYDQVFRLPVDSVVDLESDRIHNVDVISLISLLRKVVFELDIRKELPF